jgi:hypothetical protein
MKIKLLALCAAGLGLTGLAAPGAAAQDDRAGTQAMEELLVPVTPRTVALGNALTSGLTDIVGVEAVQSNPAGILASTGTNAMFSRMEYVEDIGINYFGVSQTFGANSVALTLTSWDYGDIERTTETRPDVNPNAIETYSASTYVFGATYSRQFTDRIGAGATLKALGRTIDDVNSNGLAFDAGITYIVPESGLRFGVSLQNLGAEMTFGGDGLRRSVPNQGPNGPGSIAGEIDDLPAQLPSVLNFGAAYTRQFAGDVSVSTMANFRSVSYDQDQYAAGVELGYANLVYARGGFNVTQENDQDFWQGWNIGGGLNLDVQSTTLRVDYAYRPSDVFGNVNLFSVAVGL